MSNTNRLATDSALPKAKDACATDGCPNRATMLLLYVRAFLNGVGYGMGQS